ncbi:MAG TPA: acyl-CoA dehydrogenase family protein [Polyangiaceae bacterium]|nr:acyl-CoA dehydrogenase family protein [Polyangiaceae bacterium]
MEKNQTVSRLVATAAHIGAEIAGPAARTVDKEARFPREAIDALKEARLLSAFVPTELGGFGCGMIELAQMCETLAQHCASAAMVFAMHQIQVASIARHSNGSSFFRDYLREIATKQSLIASVTSEVGIGGEMRNSSCAVERQGERFKLDKDASTISYGAHADDLLVTARRSPEAPANDQSLILVRKADYSLEQTGAWDTLGMRGTCSPPFKLRSTGSADQILATPFADIAAHTMVPFSHVLWANCWLGIATAAVSKSRAFVRGQARAKPGTVPPSALRLAEVAGILQTMRANVHDVATECERLMNGPGAGTEVLSSIAFALKMNNVKISTSTTTSDIVNRCLLICGIMGYKNDSKFSMGQYLRDSLSAALMVSNDRVYATNASMLLVLKDD